MGLEIQRFAYSPMGTFGKMTMPDGTELFTVEEVWRKNEQNISCIPEGSYHCEPRFYNRGGYEAIHVTDVPGRTLILFHRGNTIDSVEGCIAPGMKLGFIAPHWSVGNSTKAFKILMQHYGQKNFELEVTGYDPDTDNYLVGQPREPQVTRSGSWSAPLDVLRQHGVSLEAFGPEVDDVQIIGK